MDIVQRHATQDTSIMFRTTKAAFRRGKSNPLFDEESY